MTITSVSGIRGVVGTDLKVIDYANIGESFGKYIKGGVCAVCRDTRSTSRMASEAVISGLMVSGCTVFDLGVTSTPALFREVRANGLEGGISITASHNPPEWNGIKFALHGGRLPFNDELKELLNLLASPIISSYKFGAVYQIEPRYPSDIIKYFGERCCENLNVVLDLGGGGGSNMVPMIFRELGCKVLTVNASPGIFSRGMDPTNDDLLDLSGTVKMYDADIGFAYDCDADRVIFVGEDGCKLPADYTLLIYLKHLAETGKMKDFVAAVDTSLAVEDIVGGAGSKLFYSKVGEANILRLMLEKGCPIGGEGCSGGLIVTDFNLCRDGVLASVLVAKVVKQMGSISDATKGIPKHHCLRKKIKCSSKEALRVVRTLAEEDTGDLDLIDGVKIKKRDRSWILIRPSNTENILRISAGAETEKKVSMLIADYSKRISNLLEESAKR